MSTVHTLASILSPARGIVAVIGSGGKSTLLARGARELAAQGARAVLATSTHMQAPHGVPLVRTLAELDAALAAEPVACIGAQEEGTGKLIAPACGFDALAHRADYVLVEADGSRRLPLKAHAAYEPIIPAHTALRMLVVGASGFGKPIGEVVHRSELFCALTGAAPTDAATPALVAAAIAAEGLAGASDAVIVNQAEDELEGARALQCALGRPVYAGGIRTGRLHLLDGDRAAPGHRNAGRPNAA